MYASRSCPLPSSTWYSLAKLNKVLSEMWTRLKTKVNRSENARRPSFSYPEIPLASIWFANVTSFDQVSYCPFFRPKTPHKTRPVWIPIRISTLTPVASRTNLKFDEHSTMKKIEDEPRILLDIVDHFQAHSNTIRRVIRSTDRQTTHTIITIAKNFYSHAVAFLYRTNEHRFISLKEKNWKISFSFTWANWSNLPKSLLRIWTNSGGVNFSDNGVKLTMSA